MAQRSFGWQLRPLEGICLRRLLQTVVNSPQVPTPWGRSFVLPMCMGLMVTQQLRVCVHSCPVWLYWVNAFKAASNNCEVWTSALLLKSLTCSLL